MGRYDNFGNLATRKDVSRNMEESFFYDIPPKPHALDKVGKVKMGNDSLVYTYGYGHQRIAMEEHVGNTVRTKRYVGACERVTETMGSLTIDRWLTYLSGPTGVYAVVVTMNGTNTLHYILKDNLGSWTTITDSDGVVEQRLSYDAWGNLRNPETWSGSFTGTPMFDRGFTGHEHLYNFGLINMKFTVSERSAKLCLSTAERCELGEANGRMYDPMMSSFLSVDQYVQNPENSQNFNRYAYCLNNPLRYVDPSGWRKQEPIPGRTPTSDDNYRDIYTYVERALEPRDLGILQLPTDDPSVVWMEENEMHGGGGSGGFYVNLASGLIEHHNGKTNVEYLKQGLLFLAVENASIGDIENALEQKGLSYQKDPNVLGGYLVDTEEMFKGYLLWQSIPSMTTVFALGSVECLFNSISLFLSSIKSIEKTTNISYEFTNATLNRMDDPARRVPLNILDEVIKNPQVVGPDPQGTAAKMYYSTIYKNGKLYNIEVLYKQSNNTIYHFLYSPSPLGPMPLIKP